MSAAPVSDLVHLVFCLRRLPHLSRQAFQAYWRDVHGPLVRERAEALGIVRYVQSHALADAVSSPMMAPRGAPAPFDGVAQLWWRDARGRTAAQKEAARRANAELLEDERGFIDLAASPIFVTADHEVIRLFVDSRPGLTPAG